jgi:hypothetical protein
MWLRRELIYVPSYVFLGLSLSDGLRERLLALGTTSQLVTIRPGEDCDLYLEHAIVDAQYFGVASRESLKKRYSAKMWLVEDERVVKYREIIREQSSSAGLLPVPKLSAEKTFFKGKVLFKKEMGVGVGFKKPGDPSSSGKVYQYDFDVAKIRGPVKELVESSGWRFEQIIMNYKPRKRAVSTPPHASYCSQCGTQLSKEAVFCTNCGQKIS